MHDRVSISQPRDSQLTAKQGWEKKEKRLNELAAETARLLNLPEDSFLLGDVTQPQEKDPSEEAAMAAAMAAYDAAKGSAAAAMPLVHAPVASGPVDASAPTVLAEVYAD